MNYQRLILVGNVTGDPEVQKSKKGTAYTRFSVAVGRGKEPTAFFPVVAFDKVGEVVAQYVRRGRQVLVEGRIRTNKARFSVVADSVTFGASTGKAS